MPSPVGLPAQVSEQLRNASLRLTEARVLIGFDGFIDTILHVVARRESAAKYTRMTAMKEFAAKVDAAAGHSANFEFVTQMVKLGGNGPIMANALGSYGMPVTYIGNLGSPNVHPIFAEFATRASVRSIAEPGYTDAVEFDDGKLMCGKHESLKDVNWANLTKHVPERELVRIFAGCTLIAMVNWTMLAHMNGIWRMILRRVAPSLQGKKRWLFFDLADPAKRARLDLAEALRQITKFQKYFRVVLGLNFPESRQVGEVLGLKAPQETYGTVTHHAARIRKALRIDTVVIHPPHFAAAADASGATYVEGPFTAKPRITTGAGDHFNAGFCVGRLLDLDLAASLQTGVATSGCYVRNAKSPRLDEVRRFLRTLK